MKGQRDHGDLRTFLGVKVRVVNERERGQVSAAQFCVTTAVCKQKSGGWLCGA